MKKRCRPPGPACRQVAPVQLAGYHSGRFSQPGLLADPIVSISLSGKRSDTASPCVGICSTVLGDAICRGCGRSFEEVLNWHQFNDDQKRAINRRLAERARLAEQAE